MHQNRSTTIRIALYGDNGHQLPVAGDPGWSKYGTVVAYAGFRADRQVARTDGIEEVGGVTTDALRRDSLDQILADPGIDLVSLCSPRRADQAHDAIRCMEAGKHVFAEKPCATMREVVASGRIGEVIQVYGQKSYPWFADRPHDEDIDGGLLRQAGIYLYRFVEHIAGVRVEATQAYESTIGNQGDDSECRRAASVIMRLDNGGVASGVANYGTPAPPRWDRWGYETVRIFGEDGFVESINHGEIVRVVTSGGIVNLAAEAAGEDGGVRRPSCIRRGWSTARRLRSFGGRVPHETGEDRRSTGSSRAHHGTAAGSRACRLLRAVRQSRLTDSFVSV